MGIGYSFYMSMIHPKPDAGFVMRIYHFVLDSVLYSHLSDIIYDYGLDIYDLEEYKNIIEDPDYAYNKVIEFFEECARRGVMPWSEVETMKKLYLQKKFKEWLGEVTEMPELQERIQESN